MELQRIALNFSKLTSLNSLRNSTLIRGKDCQSQTKRTGTKEQVVKKQTSFYLETLIHPQMGNFWPFLMIFFYHNALRCEIHPPWSQPTITNIGDRKSKELKIKHLVLISTKFVWRCFPVFSEFKNKTSNFHLI